VKQSPYSKLEDQPAEAEEVGADDQFNLNQLKLMMSSPVTIKQASEDSCSPSKTDNKDKWEQDSFNLQNVTEFTPGLGEAKNRENGNKNELDDYVEGDSKMIRTNSKDSSHDNDTKVNSLVFKGAMLRKHSNHSSSPSRSGGEGTLSNFAKPRTTDESDSIEENKENTKTIPEMTEGDISPTLEKSSMDRFFGEDSKEQAERIRKQSAFKDLRTWRLLHLIVKTGADMKEEQFALQLISQFNQIFKAEKLKLLLTHYEIMSLGKRFSCEV